jgi:flagellar assembly protein FliH
MTDVKKFMFDTNDFSQMREKVDAGAYTEEQMQLAKSQSFALGKAEGTKEAKLQQTDLLQKTLLLTEKLAAAEDRREVEKCIDVTKLAMRIVRKLMPQFSAQYALNEIENTILQSIETRKDEPRIAVIVPTVHLENLKARIDALALQKGYAGKVILLADDSLAPTDCRLEWADGGADRLFEQLFSHIENSFAQATSTMKSSIK